MGKGYLMRDVGMGEVRKQAVADLEKRLEDACRELVTLDIERLNIKRKIEDIKNESKKKEDSTGGRGSGGVCTGIVVEEYYGPTFENSNQHLKGNKKMGMNLREAVQSGRPFRRPSWRCLQEVYEPWIVAKWSRSLFFQNTSKPWTPLVQDVIADDYVVQPLKVRVGKKANGEWGVYDYESRQELDSASLPSKWSAFELCEKQN